jgi:tetratricopeptide (TPR) repeat protein
VIGTVHLWRGDAALTERHVGEAMKRATRGSEAWCTAAAYAAQTAGLRGDIDRVEHVAREALTFEGGAAWSLLLCKCATRLIHGGRRALASELLSRVTLGDDLSTRAWYLHARACEGMLGGDPIAWRDREREALVYLERVGDRRNIVSARANLAHAMIELGQLDEAEGVLGAASAPAAPMGATILVLWAKHHRSLLLARRGLYAEAASSEREVLAAAPPKRLAGAAHMYLSALALLRGDPAAALVESALSLADLDTDTPLRALACAHHANALRANGRLDDAVASAARAVEIAQAGVDEGEAAVALAWIDALLAAGRIDEASAAAEQAQQRLLARASIMDDATRTSFLGLADNAAVLRRLVEAKR